MACQIQQLITVLQFYSRFFINTIISNYIVLSTDQEKNTSYINMYIRQRILTITRNIFLHLILYMVAASYIRDANADPPSSIFSYPKDLARSLDIPLLCLSYYSKIHDLFYILIIKIQQVISKAYFILFQRLSKQKIWC